MFLLLVFHNFLDPEWRFTLKIDADVLVSLSVPRISRLRCNYSVNMLFFSPLALNVILSWCLFITRALARLPGEAQFD